MMAAPSNVGIYRNNGTPFVEYGVQWHTAQDNGTASSTDNNLYFDEMRNAYNRSARNIFIQNDTSFNNIYYYGSTSDTITITATSGGSWTTSDCGVWYSEDFNFKTLKPKDAKDKLREIIRERQAPAVYVRNKEGIWVPDRTPLKDGIDERERRARETLKTIIGEKKFRHYLKHGFVSVRNPESGRVYQMFPGHGLTFVYEDGELTERLCIYLGGGGDYAPTDSLIVQYLMALDDEEELWALANKHGSRISRPKRIIKLEETKNYNKSLSDLFKQFKDEEKVAA